MLSPLHLWLSEQGYFTKYEFKTPWGICDLVGVRPIGAKLVERLNSGAKESIGSMPSVAIFLALPSASTGRGASIVELSASLGDHFEESTIEKGLVLLKRRGLISILKNGKFQRRDSWYPYFDSILAIEFKLARIEEVLTQATHHKSITTESYVALPLAVAERALSKKGADRFHERGVGVIGLRDQSCSVLLKAGPSMYRIDPVAELHAAERFWPEMLKAVQH